MLQQKKLESTALYFSCFNLYLFFIFCATTTGVAWLDFWLTMIPLVISKTFAGLQSFFKIVGLALFLMGVFLGAVKKRKPNGVKREVISIFKIINQCNPFYGQNSWIRISAAILIPHVELCLVYPFAVVFIFYFIGSIVGLSFNKFLNRSSV